MSQNNVRLDLEVIHPQSLTAIVNAYTHTTSTTDPSSGHHFGRDAALVGGAGAAGAVFSVLL